MTILQHSLLIHHDTTRSASPSALLPSALFLAGLCSTDPIHRDWILGRLRNSGKGGGCGGGYVEKVGILLPNIWEMLDAGGGSGGGSGRQMNKERGGVGTTAEWGIEQSAGSASGGGSSGEGGRGERCNIGNVMDSHCGGRFLI
jgi:hypothetical protein